MTPMTEPTVEQIELAESLSREWFDHNQDSAHLMSACIREHFAPMLALALSQAEKKGMEKSIQVARGMCQVGCNCIGCDNLRGDGIAFRLGLVKDVPNG